MSKSGLVGRFGSKEQLQLATLDQAADIRARCNGPGEQWPPCSTTDHNRAKFALSTATRPDCKPGHTDGPGAGE